MTGTFLGVPMYETEGRGSGPDDAGSLDVFE